MEKGPGPEFRIVGGAPAEKKEEAKKELERAFHDHSESLPPEAKELLKAEYPKSEKQLAITAFANAETSRLMREAGVEPYDIPQANHHIVPKETYYAISRLLKGSSGSSYAMTFYVQQGIAFNGEELWPNPAMFAAVDLHETLHLKGYVALEVGKSDEKVSKTHYRHGVSVIALQKRRALGELHEHFHGLHEAIVSTQAKRSFSKMLELPELAEEKRWLESPEARKIREDLAVEKDLPEDEFVWIGKDGKSYSTFGYFAPRRTLSYVLEEIQTQFPEKYQSASDVFDEFLKAHFTGHLLGIAHLVEGTFGKDSFRELGNMSTDAESAVLVQESLRRMRARQIKQRES